MGHERIGFLPKTKQWSSIVQQLSLFDGEESTVRQIANMTLSCIRATYERMPFDDSVIKSMKFLALLSISAKQSNQTDYLNQHGIVIGDKISLYSLSSGARDYITTLNGSLENNKIAKDSVLQAILSYQKAHSNGQVSLFENSDENSVWKEVGSGAAFCELARSFFSAFTDRSIKYYIERSAASAINDYERLNIFSDVLSSQSDAISHHAFETSKIMQSFAAGWYNKHTINGLPSDDDFTGFLKVSFGKMREEFRREAEGQ